MKRTHIALVIVIAIAVGAIMVAMNDASTYVGFDQALQNPGSRYTVIGTLDKESPMEYDARKNRFEFTAVDKSGQEHRVLYRQPKPQDFERSEEITMKGYASDSLFIAEEILMKCPSKYNEGNKISDQTY